MNIEKKYKEFLIFFFPHLDFALLYFDVDNMSSFFPCEIDDAIQYINLGYGAQAPKIVIL